VAILSNFKAQMTFFRNNSLLSTDLHQKHMSHKAARGHFSWKNSPPDAILVFGCHFGFFSNRLFFPKNKNIFE
jgi:hypothetical protein